MTNAESNQASAIKALEQGKLTEWEKGFVQTIRNLNKKGLQKLTSKQYDTLRSIAAKAE
jgi:hypothetical protein